MYSLVRSALRAAPPRGGWRPARLRLPTVRGLLSRGETGGWTHSSSRAGDAAVQLHADDLPLCGRERELQRLQRLCEARPSSISLILGPPNSGKTRLLQHFAHHAADGAKSSSRCHINARIVSITTPADMARALVDLSLPKVVVELDLLHPFMKEGAQLAEVAASFGASLRQRLQSGDVATATLSAALEVFCNKAEVSLPEVLESYIKLLATHAKCTSEQDKDRPVLILDEANVLMSWSSEHQADLAALLRFFVAVTKELRTMHIILATSDSRFQPWLSGAIGAIGAFQTFVLGAFDEPNARRFLETQLAGQGHDDASRSGSSISDADWPLVYALCGGNAGALSNVASSFLAQGGASWEPALQHVAKDASCGVWWGMAMGRDAADAGFTTADFAAVIRQLLDSPCGAVGQDEVVDALGRAKPLDAMLAAQLLARRPYSDWADDIDPAAFGPRRHQFAITAPSPPHLFAMRAEREQLLEPLQRGSTVGASGQAAPAAAAGSAEQLVALAAEVQHVRGSLARADEELDELRAALRQPAGTGARSCQERDVLWHAVGQVRNEKQQLHELELLLLRQRLMLLQRQALGPEG